MIHNETARVLEGALIDGQYRLHHQVGEGGMGTVWAAEDLRLGRMVAAKFLSKHMAVQPRVRERFQREARMTARVRSTHVVQVFAEGCTPDDIPYLIMELLDGEDLATYLHRVGRCQLRETGAIVEQICRGLTQAHGEGLVHRDIKPHNIFLAKAETEDAPAVVKLLDFGIAKDLAALRDSLTACGEVVGSALYSSPEQLRDPQSVDRTTDIWAIGIVIFEMLTGRVPYDASSLSELIERHRVGKFPKLSSLVSGLPRELDTFLERTLHAVPNKRWSNVEELAQQYSAIVRKHSAASTPELTFSAVQTSLPAASQTGRLRRVFVVLALIMLACVAALIWKQLSAQARRTGRLPQVQAAPVLSAPAAVVQRAESTAPIELKPPQSSAAVTQPEESAPAPPPKAAAPRVKSPSKPGLRTNARDVTAPKDKPRPLPTELPGRNHGF
jgi:serine/threonine protein kinase